MGPGSGRKNRTDSATARIEKSAWFRNDADFRYWEMRRRSFIRLVGGGLGLTFAGSRWSPVNAAGLRSLSFQASWSNDAEFAGYFLAIDRGYYRQSGIDLNYFSGGPDLIPEASLVSGRADIALTVPETTAKAVASQG